MTFATVAMLATLLGAPGQAPIEPVKPFAIRVVDDRTGRGVPMVDVETVNNIRLVTDSAGVAAFDEPGLMGQQVFFSIKSPGYQFAADGFLFRGKALKTEPGGSETLSIRRINLAERLYRVTGAGIYRDTVLTGGRPPIRHPLLNAQVMGSDSALSAVYRGKIHWFWGDTNKPAHPLGNFHSPGATSLLPGWGGLDPSVGVDLDYYVDADGFARPACRMPGEGPTWLSALVVVTDGSGQERMFAQYAKIRNWLEVYERGLVEWNDDNKRFEKVATWPMTSQVYPDGHPFVRDGRVYYCKPVPDHARPRRPRLDGQTGRVRDVHLPQAGKPARHARDRSRPEGNVRYSWKSNTPAIGPREQARLIETGALRPEETLFPLRDFVSGDPVVAHGGSVSWNAHRGRWVLIAVQAEGKPSRLGEVWFAEADTPVGPWAYARKVATHPRYSFYNPKQHPYFEKENGRVIFFEGTYSTTFSGNDNPTPRYDYNQLMYRLDLAEPALTCRCRSTSTPA